MANSDIANRWQGRTDPPPALPLCGFYGQLCKEANLGQETSKLLAGRAARGRHHQ
ncbi:hypothetical protein RvY_11488 [Ramazzottius varieornatus]|uniref:Uncharacterized protein n=1 Tax=Ramazzottius varieornatus TaxID=947166 RepID=A0A1D1VGB9_RAMVA|nr:hypothetical protein RvY_11488 [Ramazzottius varieornatus]